MPDRETRGASTQGGRQAVAAALQNGPAPTALARVSGWIRFALFLAVLSIAAVVARTLAYPAPIPRALYRVLDWYVEPGLTVWWCTLGGVFEGFPSDQAGYIVTVTGNVAFWLAMSFIALRIGGRLQASRAAR